MKLKRSEIDSKSKLFESDDKHIKFVDTDFPENFVIVTKSCKTLRFKNCFFANVIIDGDFDSIYFDQCGGTIFSSKFSCKKININGNNGKGLKLKDTSIENLQSLKVINDGDLSYINTLVPLMLKDISISQKSVFTLDSSSIITNFISFSENSTFIARTDISLRNLSGFEGTSILCNDLFFDDNCTSIIDTHISSFTCNGIPMKYLKNVSKDEMPRLAKLYELFNLLNKVSNVKRIE